MPRATLKLSGAYAALSDDRFLVDNRLLNASLVMTSTLESSSGSSSGFASADQSLLCTTARDAAAPGMIQRLELTRTSAAVPTHMVEAPVLANAYGAATGAAFTRTLAALSNRSAIVSLSTSGFTVLLWNYDAPAPTRTSRPSAARRTAPGRSRPEAW